MQAEVYIVTEDRLLAPVDAREMSDGWLLDDTVRWIKITSATPEEVERALQPLELEPRLVHACTHPQPPQVEAFEKVLFMALPTWKPDSASTPALRFICVASSLITIQDERIDLIEEMAQHLLHDLHLREAHTGALVVDLTEVMASSLDRAYLVLRPRVHAVAEALERTPGEIEVDDWLALKRLATRLSNLRDDYLYCRGKLREARSDTLQLDRFRTDIGYLVGDIQRGHGLISRMEERIRDLRQSSLSYLQQLTNRRLNLREARWTIENYRQYFNEQRLHGALNYVPPVEFKQRWLAEHPTDPGAPPPGPRDLPLCASQQKGNNESRTPRAGGPASASMADQRSGCVPAEPYPPAGPLRVIETRPNARGSPKITVEVGNPNK